MAKKLSDIEKEIESSRVIFNDYLKNILSADIYLSLNKISKKSNVYIFSGVIRNFFLGISNARDIDIVIDKEIHIDHFFPKHHINKNSFGGYKVKVTNTIIDIWHIKNTWAFKNEPVLDFDLDLEKHIPNTAFFNFSSIVYSFNKKEFYFSKHFLRFLRDKKIDVVYRPNANYSLCIINSIYYSDTYHLKIADTLKKYILKLHNRNENNYEQVQRKHFGKILYTSKEIDKRLHQL